MSVKLRGKVFANIETKGLDYETVHFAYVMVCGPFVASSCVCGEGSREISEEVLWRGWLEKVSYSTVMLDCEQGGLGVENVKVKLEVLRARTVLRLLARNR